ncbi:MAG: TetR/AcrR family transcriptional regulator [bacterium]|nr:TetR/AcrR family transcriptional regulator [bacterium]
MVQVPNEELRQRILQTARQTFLKVGFHAASIRTIAREVGTTKSNIYTYFASKDDLFCKVVEPTLDEIHAVLDFVGDQEALQNYLAQGRRKGEATMFANFIQRNRENLKLLLLQSTGTSLEDFRDRFNHAHNKVMEQALPVHAAAQNLPDDKMSPFMIHFVSSAFLRFIEEVIRFDLAYDKILEHAEEYDAYHTAGVFAVLSRE